MEERVTSGVGFLSDANAVTTAVEAIASSQKGLRFVGRPVCCVSAGD